MEYDCLSSSSDSSKRMRLMHEATKTTIVDGSSSLNNNNKVDDNNKEEEKGFYTPEEMRRKTEENDWDFSSEEMSKILETRRRELGLPPFEIIVVDPNKHYKTMEEMTDEELWRSMSESHDGTVDIQPFLPEIRKLRILNKQLEETEGFGGDEWPKRNIPPGCIYRAQCCPERWPDSYKEYMEFAEFAIQDYNDKNGTKFKVLQVDRVNMIFDYACAYFMTFTAENADDKVTQIFQAQLRARMSGIKQSHELIKPFKELDFCRLKPEKHDYLKVSGPRLCI